MTVISILLAVEPEIGPVGPVDCVPFDVGKGGRLNDSVFVVVAEPLPDVGDLDDSGVVVRLSVLLVEMGRLWLPDPVAPILDVLFPPGYGAVELTPA